MDVLKAYEVHSFGNLAGLDMMRAMGLRPCCRICLLMFPFVDEELSDLPDGSVGKECIPDRQIQICRHADE